MTPGPQPPRHPSPGQRQCRAQKLAQEANYMHGDLRARVFWRPCALLYVTASVCGEDVEVSSYDRSPAVGPISYLHPSLLAYTSIITCIYLHHYLHIPPSLLAYTSIITYIYLHYYLYIPPSLPAFYPVVTCIYLHHYLTLAPSLPDSTSYRQ